MSKVHDTTQHMETMVAFLQGFFQLKLPENYMILKPPWIRQWEQNVIRVRCENEQCVLCVNSGSTM